MAFKRLKISCFKSLGNAKKNSGATASITVAANPESVSFSISADTKDNKDTGRYSGSADFNLIIDGTGALYESDKTVSEQVDFIKKLTIAYHKESKSSSFIKLDWGNVFSGIGAGASPNKKNNFFIGKVTKIGIKYTLFSESGEPLRADVDLSVEQLVDLGEQGSFAQNIDFYKESDSRDFISFRHRRATSIKVSYQNTQKSVAKQSKTKQVKQKPVKTGLR